MLIKVTEIYRNLEESRKCHREIWINTDTIWKVLPIEEPEGITPALAISPTTVHAEIWFLEHSPIEIHEAPDEIASREYATLRELYENLTVDVCY